MDDHVFVGKDFMSNKRMLIILCKLYLSLVVTFYQCKSYKLLLIVSKYDDSSITEKLQNHRPVFMQVIYIGILL